MRRLLHLSGPGNRAIITLPALSTHTTCDILDTHMIRQGCGAGENIQAGHGPSG
jgi:hypothetical protein